MNLIEGEKLIVKKKELNDEVMVLLVKKDQKIGKMFFDCLIKYNSNSVERWL